MPRPTPLIGFLAICTVACVGTLVFAANPPAPDPKPVVSSVSKCPLFGGTLTGAEQPPVATSDKPVGGPFPYGAKEWWPNQLNLDVLHKHSAKGSPLGEGFDYPEEFKKLDRAANVLRVLALRRGGALG